MSFGETLSRLRQDRGITQGELASKVYVTRQAVSLMGAMLPDLKRWKDQ